MFVYLYSTSHEIVRAFSSDQKIKLLPYVINNILKDLSNIDEQQYRLYSHLEIESFEDENLQKMLSILSNNSGDKRFHIVEEVQLDTQLPFFNDHLPAPPPRRAPPLATPRLTDLIHPLDPAPAGVDFFDEIAPMEDDEEEE